MSKVLPVPLVPRVSLVPLVPLDHEVLLVFRVSLDLQVPRVQLVFRV